MPIVNALDETAPEATLKFVPLKDATPFVLVVASSPVMVTVEPVPEVERPVPLRMLNECVEGATEPLSVTTALATVSSRETLPEVTSKSPGSNCATPLLLVVASSPSIVI